MIRTFKSTGIGNEHPFDAEEAERWRRLKEESRRDFGEHYRRVGAPSCRNLEEGAEDARGEEAGPE